MMPVAKLSDAELKVVLTWLEQDACINIFMPKLLKEEVEQHQFDLVQGDLKEPRREDVLRGRCLELMDIARLHDVVLDELESRRSEKAKRGESDDPEPSIESELPEEESD